MLEDARKVSLALIGDRLGYGAGGDRPFRIFQRRRDEGGANEVRGTLALLVCSC